MYTNIHTLNSNKASLRVLLQNLQASGIDSDPVMQRLMDQLLRVVLQDRATSTTTQYINGFHRWVEWVQVRTPPLPLLPAAPLHIALYLLSLMQTSSTAAPVITAFYSIAWSHRVAMLEPPTDNPLPKSILEAANRSIQSQGTHNSRNNFKNSVRPTQLSIHRSST